MPEPYYCTADDLRTELGVDSTVLPDDRATTLIQDAEDIVDRLLGGWTWGPNQDSGRKVTSTDVQPWQFAKLGRATAKFAARLYSQPQLLDQLYEHVSGPDFSFSGPKGGAVAKMLGVQVLSLLDDSGLRRIAGRARQGNRLPRGMKPTYDRFLRATRHDGT